MPEPTASLPPVALDADAPSSPALRRAVAAVERALQGGRPWALTESLVRLGRCYRRLDAHDAAARSFEQALRWAVVTGGVDQRVDVLSELAEARADEAELRDDEDPGRARVLRDLARDLVYEAAAQAARVADPGWEATALLRLSDVLDRFGDSDDASYLQLRALRLTAGGAYGDARSSETMHRSGPRRH
jgi:tetratricopeptide (TPR) repeat protein